MSELHVHEWGERGAPPVVCLHGVTGHGGRFRGLAEEWLSRRFHVVALDLRGHGLSTWDEPWTFPTYLDDVRETVDALGIERADWIGHSFGGRLIMELTAQDPDRVERAVLLDPAIWVPPSFAAEAAEGYLVEESFGTLDEVVDQRMVSSGLTRTPRDLLVAELSAQMEEGEDGRLRYRYSGPSVGAAYMEMSLPPPAFERLRIPTLLLLGSLSKIVSGAEVELYREALGDLLRVGVVPGGHSLLWEAFDETARAVDDFL
jgi:lipase